MDYILLKLIRYSHNLYGTKRTTLYANTATYAQRLIDDGLAFRIRKVNRHYTASYRGAIVLALVVASFRMASFPVKNSYMQLNYPGYQLGFQYSSGISS